MTDTPAAAGTLVERLRDATGQAVCSPYTAYLAPVMHEAADALSACRAELAAARANLGRVDRWHALNSAMSKFVPEQMPQYFDKPTIVETLAEVHPVALVRQAANYILRLRAAKEESERLLAAAANDAERYHRAMGLIGDTQMAHGKCQPRSDKACTACNAQDALSKLLAAYGGPPIQAALASKEPPK